MLKNPHYNDPDLFDDDDKNDEIIKDSIDCTMMAYFINILDLSDNSLPDEILDRSVNHLKALT